MGARSRRWLHWTLALIPCALLAGGCKPGGGGGGSSGTTEGPVEIIVAAGPGGAADQMAHVIQGAALKHQLIPNPISISLKGGASGGEALIETKAAAKDPHKLLLAVSNIYTLPLGVGLPFHWTDLTPVAMIALDPFLLWVHADTPYKTAGEYLAAVKAAAPSTFKMGGVGSKREDQIITAAIEKSQGVKFAYIPYKSGGEAATQLVGKHIDSNVNNPSENVEQWRAGQVRPLCVFDEARMPFQEKVADGLAWADIPTCKEAGLDVQYRMLRGFLMPSGVSPAQVAFFEDLLRKVVATPEWKEYVQRSALGDTFVSGAEFRKFLEEDERRHQTLMAEAGFLASAPGGAPTDVGTAPQKP